MILLIMDNCNIYLKDYFSKNKINYLIISYNFLGDKLEEIYDFFVCNFFVSIKCIC